MISNTEKGMLLTVLSTLLFASQDSITKHLAADLPLSQFIGIRYCVFLVFVLLWALHQGEGLKPLLRTRQRKTQLARGLLLALEVLLFAQALRYLGVGQMHAIFAAYPLIVTALSPWWLGESVGWRRWSAVLLGFVGTLIIISPGASGFSAYSLLGLLCALMFALYNLLTRRVGVQDSANTSLFYNALVGVVLFLPAMLWQWQPLASAQWIWILILCVLSVCSHLCLIVALRLATAVVLQPLNYFTLFWAACIGALVWQEIPAVHQVAGSAIVVACGIYVAWRQRYLARQQASSEAVAESVFPVEKPRS